MTRITCVLLVHILAAVAFADVGSQWPDAKEIAKAPAWPKAFRGDPTQCKKIEPEKFLSNVNKPTIEDQNRYVIETQVDLDLDGVCEVIAYRPVNCGKWCAYEGFRFHDGMYQLIGEITLGEFLEPYNGWLQIKSSSYTGAYYFYFLTRFQDGAYKYYRRDEFKEDVAERKTMYLRTLEGQVLEESGKGQ